MKPNPTTRETRERGKRLVRDLTRWTAGGSALGMAVFAGMAAITIPGQASTAAASASSGSTSTAPTTTATSSASSPTGSFSFFSGSSGTTQTSSGTAVAVSGGSR